MLYLLLMGQTPSALLIDPDKKSEKQDKFAAKPMSRSRFRAQEHVVIPYGI